MKFRHRKNSHSETGQTIILIALLIIILIALLGLAIDGGSLMLMKRDVQNAVDSTVMAAAYAHCTHGNFDVAARNAARRSGYIDGVDDTTIRVNSPPADGPGAGNQEFVEVVISRKKPKYFIQLFYSGDLEVTARGVGYCLPGSDIYAGKAIFAASDFCNYPVSLTGSQLSIHNGGFFSNNDALLQGAAQFIGGESGAVNGVNYLPGKATFNPSANNPAIALSPVTHPPDLYHLRDFQPGSTLAQTYASTGNYQAYSGNAIFTKETLPQGLIYVDGNVTFRDMAADVVTVTIVATGNINLVNVSNTEFSAFARNLLFFSAAQNSGCGASAGISTSGQYNNYIGLFYAPDAAILFSGSEHKLQGALIGNMVTVSASDTNIYYTPTVIPSIPPQIVIAE